jgi:hypothetical protein
MSTNTTANVKHPELGDLETTVIALHGIFWALHMLVVHHAADDIAHENDLHNGIDALILAGERLAAETAERF